MPSHHSNEPAASTVPGIIATWRQASFERRNKASNCSHHEREEARSGRKSSPQGASQLVRRSSATLSRQLEDESSRHHKRQVLVCTASRGGSLWGKHNQERQGGDSNTRDKSTNQEKRQKTTHNTLPSWCHQNLQQHSRREREKHQRRADARAHGGTYASENAIGTGAGTDGGAENGRGATDRVATAHDHAVTGHAATDHAGSARGPGRRGRMSQVTRQANGCCCGHGSAAPNPAGRESRPPPPLATRSWPPQRPRGRASRPRRPLRQGSPPGNPRTLRVPRGPVVRRQAKPAAAARRSAAASGCAAAGSHGGCRRPGPGHGCRGCRDRRGCRARRARHGRRGCRASRARRARRGCRAHHARHARHARHGTSPGRCHDIRRHGGGHRRRRRASHPPSRGHHHGSQHRCRCRGSHCHWCHSRWRDGRPDARGCRACGGQHRLAASPTMTCSPAGCGPCRRTASNGPTSPRSGTPEKSAPAARNCSTACPDPPARRRPHSHRAYPAGGRGSRPSWGPRPWAEGHPCRVGQRSAQTPPSSDRRLHDGRAAGTPPRPHRAGLTSLQKQSRS